MFQVCRWDAGGFRVVVLSTGSYRVQDFLVFSFKRGTILLGII